MKDVEKKCWDFAGPDMSYGEPGTGVHRHESFKILPIYEKKNSKSKKGKFCFCNDGRKAIFNSKPETNTFKITNRNVSSMVKKKN